MSRRRRRQTENSGGGGPAWITTFSDLMSLLLTFFILLFSMSSISADKFDNVATSFQSVLSGSNNNSILNNQDTIVEFSEELMRNEQMYNKVSEYLENENLGSNVSVSMNTKGVFVEMKDAILFEPGSASLKPEGIEVLKQLKGLINDFDNELVIEGYTDDVPMSSPRYPTNWELSTARAVSVVRHLAEVENIDPKRLSAVGYGEYSPIVPNDSIENRASNRRVNILIIFDEESDS
ncbi:MAG: flagellar motor protein MotB [Tissierellaceae bacterium]|nr:flagellar motor protein MotB [Tissierellaceae bacterium]